MVESKQITLLSGQLDTLVVFAIIAFFVNWIAWYNGFYKFPKAKPRAPVPVTIFQVICVFGIYLGIMYFGNIFIASILQRFFTLSETSAGFFQFITSSSVLFALYLFCKTQDKTVIHRIWKDPASPSPIVQDFGLGILIWFISYPIVMVISSLCEILVVNVFHLVSHEQIVVQYLKSIFSYPFLLSMMLLVVLVVAPITEEFLFRGFLQNFFKKHLGRKAAILLASFCFALFHYSQGQAAGNVSLIVSLFAFSCFLGFIYERQGSLFANIALHMMFNLATTLMIAFDL